MQAQVETLLSAGEITTTAGTLPLAPGVREVSICCHSDTPVRPSSLLFFLREDANVAQGAVEIARVVKALVDENNAVVG